MTDRISRIVPRPAALAALAAAALSVASCAAPETGPTELERVEARYEADARTYRREQARITEDLELPAAYAFDGEGTLIVHRVELLGGPERSYVRARFTYVNSTGRSVPIPTVHLMLHNPAGEVVEVASLELVRPLGTTFAHDNAYTGWIDAETRGLYRKAGWTWSMDLDVPQPKREAPPLSSRG